MAALTTANSVRECEALRRAVPKEVRELARTLKKAGHRSWAVGGSVRDIVRAAMRGQEMTFHGDWDVATDARPEQVRAAFRRVIPTGLAHGTVTVLIGSVTVEVTTLRGERGHTDGRRPDEVFYVDDLTLDLARRDFTVNAIAFDLDREEIIDPFSGRLDLERGCIRAVGDAKARYTEDGLRPLRAARFSAQLEMELEPETLHAIRPTLDRFRLVSKERVRDEWLKALKTPHPSRFFRILLGEGLLEATLPGLLPDQSPTVLDPILARVDSGARDPIRRLTHFLSGALEVRESSPPERASLAEAQATLLRLSNKERNRIGSLIRAERLPSPDERAVRHYLAQVGRDEAMDALDYLAERGTPSEMLRLLKLTLESGAPLSPKELTITGRDLILAGVPEGPVMKTTLRALMSLVLDDPSANNKEQLVAYALGLSTVRTGDEPDTNPVS